MDANQTNSKEQVGSTDLTKAEGVTIAAYLLETKRRLGSVRYLEIGVFAGGTLHFLKMIVPDCHFVGIDLFEDFSLSDDNTHKTGTFTKDDVQSYVGNDVLLIKGDSPKVLDTITETFDFIFIDGNHTYDGTWADFRHALPLLAPDGRVAFHNCSTWIPPDFTYVLRDGGPWQVTEELKRQPEWKLEAEVERLRIFSHQRPI
jgi:predicted O-methyltransferase YrrM